MRTIIILVIVSVLVCMALFHPSLQLHIPTPMDPHTDSKSVVVVVEMQALSPSPVEEEDDDGGNSGVAIVLLKCPPSLPYLLVKEYDFSPLLDIVPGYVASNVSIRIPADCHLNNSSIVNNQERLDEVDTNFLRAMQSFLYRYLPLLEETTTSSIPIVSYNNNNGYDYEQCDGCKTTTLSKINKRQEKDGDGNGDDNSNPSNLHRRRRRCNRIRGRRGLWRYDAAYANASYYVDTTWIMGKELANGPYNHSSWMWQQPSLEDADDNDNGYYNSYCEEEGGEVELMTREGFCRSVAALNVTRLMVLGDSMEYMRLISFFHIIGEWGTTNVHSHLRPRYRMRYEQSIVCNNSSTGMESNTENAFTVSVVFYRTNHLMPLLVETKASNNNETIPPLVLSQQEKGRHQMQQRMGTEKGLKAEYFTCYGVRPKPPPLP